MRLVRELQRRRVFGSVAAYALASLAAIEGADILVPRLGLPDRVVGVVVFVAILGLPFVVAVAWTYDWSWGRWIRDPGDVARESGQRAGTERRGDLMDDRDEELPLASNGVAVLPFVSLGPHADRDYFSEGVTEEITTALCRVPELRVISRTSAAEVGGPGGGGIRKIGRRLGVAVVVEGSVRRQGGRVRIAAKAIDVDTESALWADSFDGEMEDIFDVQSSVARRVAEAMAAQVSPEMERGYRDERTSDPEAYDLYLRALHLWNQRAEDAFRSSLANLEQALVRDPEFALARAQIALIYMTMGIYGLVDPETAQAKIFEAAEHALESGAPLAEARVARGCARAMYRWQWAEAEADLRDAIQSNPSFATAHQWLALNILAPQGRFQEARTALGHARRIDPVSPAVGVSSGVLAYLQHDAGSALSHFEEVLRLHPDFAPAHFFRGLALAAAGEHARAIEVEQRLIEDTGGTAEMISALGYCEALAGRHSEAVGRLRSLGEARSWVSPVLLAQIHVGLGSRDAALDALEDAAAQRAPDLVWVGRRPVFEPLRGDERFSEILRRVGIAGP